jgi:sugar lactone lactonase YvrE
LCFSVDGRRAFFADTPRGCIEVADLEPGTGDPGAWRLFDDGKAPGHPDGATIDAEGCLWSARPGGGCLARFTPDGHLDRLVLLPVSRPTSCAFGGSDLRTLFVTTSRQRLSAEELATEPLAGRLLALDVGACGIAEPSFK